MAFATQAEPALSKSPFFKLWAPTALQSPSLQKPPPHGDGQKASPQSPTRSQAPFRGMPQKEHIHDTPPGLAKRRGKEGHGSREGGTKEAGGGLAVNTQQGSHCWFPVASKWRPRRLMGPPSWGWGRHQGDGKTRMPIRSSTGPRTDGGTASPSPMGRPMPGSKRRTANHYLPLPSPVENKASALESGNRQPGGGTSVSKVFWACGSKGASH